MNYVQPSPPTRYILKQTAYRCGACGAEFRVRTPQDNDLVKYIEPVSGEERWMPTYGEGGYLQMMKRLVPEFASGKGITMAVSRKFETAFALIQERSKAGQPFRLFIRPMCPKCGSTDLTITSETCLNSPPVCWMRYVAES